MQILLTQYCKIEIFAQIANLVLYILRKMITFAAVFVAKSCRFFYIINKIKHLL